MFLKKLKRFNKEVKQYYKEKDKRHVAILYLALRVLVILCLVREILLGNYHNVFLCLLTLLLFFIPYLVDDKLHIKLPNTLEMIILLFIFSAEILGEIQNFYGLIPNWDMILHTINGFLAAAIGFSLIDILNTTERFHIKMTPIFVALVSFCFSMTVGVVWEFFEFGTDRLLHIDMQKDTVVTNINSVSFDETKTNTAIHLDDITKTIIYYDEGKTKEMVGYLDLGGIDTMEDLFVNFIGALTFSVLGFFYIKNRDGYRFAESFIARKKNFFKIQE